MKYFWAILALIITAGIQGNLPSYISILGAKPDLVLVVLISYSLAADPAFGATLGFVAGLLHGSPAVFSLGSFIVTRTITGFLAGLVTTRLFSENPLVPALCAVWLTIVCEALFLLANPRPDFAVACRAVAGECIGNAILTLFIHYALRGLSTHHKIKLANARI